MCDMFVSWKIFTCRQMMSRISRLQTLGSRDGYVDSATSKSQISKSDTCLLAIMSPLRYLQKKTWVFQPETPSFPARKHLRSVNFSVRNIHHINQYGWLMVSCPGEPNRLPKKLDQTNDLRPSHIPIANQGVDCWMLK